MTTCDLLATKQELNDLKELVEQKIDRSERSEIIQASVKLSIPQAIAGAISALSPDIGKAVNDASRALKQTASNAGKIVKNTLGVAANLSNILGILVQLGTLALVLKHEFFDLPRIEAEQQAQDRAIKLNQELIFLNRKLISEQARKFEQQIKDSEAKITREYQEAIKLSELKLRSEFDGKIAELRAETIVTIAQRERKLRLEYKAAIEFSELITNAKILELENRVNQKIQTTQVNLDVFKAFTNSRIIALDATVSGLRNTLNGVRSDIGNLRTVKADNIEVTRIRQKAIRTEDVANIALKTAQDSISFRQSSVGSVGTTGTATASQRDIQNLQTQNQQLQTELTNLGNNAVQQQQLDTFRKDLIKDFELVLGGAGLLAVPALLNRVDTKIPTASQITSATETGICNSTRSGGCLNGNVFNPLNGKLDSIINGVGAGASAANLAISNNILTRVTSIQTAVNSTTFGLSAINTFMRNAWQNTNLDKVLNVLNTVLALHNALMLSRNLASSLGDVTSQALSFLGIKDAEGNSLDVNSFIGSTVNTWITNLVGAETYANIQTTWISLNRIMVAAQGVVYAVQGIKNAVLEGVETVGSWTAQIGNNMMLQGLFEDRSFPWMNENVNFRNPFGRFIQKIETTEEIVGQVNSLVSSGIEAQENFNQLLDTSNELTTASQELQNNLTQFDLDKQAIEDSESLTSASPNITNQDLIKDENTEVDN